MSTELGSVTVRASSAAGTATGTLDAGRVATDLLAGALRGSGPPPAVQTPRLRVGVDLVEVADVVRSLEMFGDRYVQRIFTPHEIACCRLPGPAAEPGDRRVASAHYSCESLAARFAAKEAAIKVLHPEGPRPEWRSIEVYRAEGGWCELRLSGLADVLARRSGLDQLAVSLTHEAAIGAAVVVATGSGPIGHDDPAGHHDDDDPHTDHPGSTATPGARPISSSPTISPPFTSSPTA